eukprot:scaffold726_cov320-Prasinococcus_capsulatus_cf.AAC.1
MSSLARSVAPATPRRAHSSAPASFASQPAGPHCCGPRPRSLLCAMIEACASPRRIDSPASTTSRKWEVRLKGAER